MDIVPEMDTTELPLEWASSLLLNGSGASVCEERPSPFLECSVLVEIARAPQNSHDQPQTTN
jgi:hypothetical protein